MGSDTILAQASHGPYAPQVFAHPPEKLSLTYMSGQGLYLHLCSQPLVYEGTGRQQQWKSCPRCTRTGDADSRSPQAGKRTCTHHLSQLACMCWTREGSVQAEKEDSMESEWPQCSAMQGIFLFWEGMTGSPTKGNNKILGKVLFEIP